MIKTEKQDDSIKGWLLLWVIVTILLLFITIPTSFSNPDNMIGWVMNALLITSLIMVLTASGTRWIMIITGFIFGALFLYSAVTVNPSTVCVSSFWSVCAYSGPARDAIIQAAQALMLTSIFYSVYMFASSLYFACSKRVKARFKKQ